MREESREKRRLKAVQKELAVVRRREERREQAVERRPSQWKELLEKKVPPKVKSALETAFYRAFALVFEKGGAVIEKSYDRDSIREEYQVRDYAVKVRGRKRELRSMRRGALSADRKNLAVSAVEGLGLGLLGIGLPDIVLFTGMILRGIYETALRFGYDYTALEEKLLILRMMEASVASGERRRQLNGEIDRLLEAETAGAEAGKMVGQGEITPEMMEKQIRRTSEALAADMLLLKFVQGLPVAGAAGGVGNPVCYSRILNYVRGKYEKRYLLKTESRLLHREKPEKGESV